MVPDVGAQSARPWTVLPVYDSAAPVLPGVRIMAAGGVVPIDKWELIAVVLTFSSGFVETVSVTEIFWVAPGVYLRPDCRYTKKRRMKEELNKDFYQ